MGDTGASAEPLETFSLVARRLAEHEGLGDTLQGTVDAVPGAQHAGLSMVRARKKVDTMAGTGDVVEAVDRVQYETGEGPCLDAIYEQEIVQIADLSATDRWPALRCGRPASASCPCCRSGCSSRRDERRRGVPDPGPPVAGQRPQAPRCRRSGRRGGRRARLSDASARRTCLRCAGVADSGRTDGARLRPATTQAAR